MAETLNKRIRPALAAEARENARRYWAKKNLPAESPRPQSEAKPSASALPPDTLDPTEGEKL